jgi:deoxyribonucleoside regulator
MLMSAVKNGLRLLVRVSEMYYQEKLTQQQIAAALGLSRPKISRLLKAAEDRGIVQIRIINPLGETSALEEELCRRFNLKEAVVALCGGGRDSKRAIGEAAAAYLERNVCAGNILGVSWGTTLQEMVNCLHPDGRCPDLTVFQMLGGVGQAEGDYHANELARRIAEAFGGRWYPLPAPVVVSSSQVRDALLAEKRLAEIFDNFHRIDTALVGIGCLADSILKKTGYLSDEEGKELAYFDAVGDVCSCFFDIEGRVCRTSLHDRVVGISPQALRNIDTVIGMAGGADKIEAITGALRGGFINILVTDELTAERVLEHSSKSA